MTTHQVGQYVAGVIGVLGWFVQIIDTAANDRLVGGIEGLGGNLSLAGVQAIGPVKNCCIWNTNEQVLG